MSNVVEQNPTPKGPPKSAGQLRDEQYVQLMVGMKDGLDSWKGGKVPNKDALARAEGIMNQLKDMKQVDGVRVRDMMDRQGINDDTRRQLERTFQELQKQCNKTPDVFRQSANYEPGFMEQLQDTVTGGDMSAFMCCGAPANSKKAAT